MDFPESVCVAIARNAQREYRAFPPERRRRRASTSFLRLSLSWLVLHCIALHCMHPWWDSVLASISSRGILLLLSQISILTLLSVCVNRKCVSSDREGFSSLFGRAFASCACCCSVGVWQKGTGGKAKVGAALTPIKQSSTLLSADSDCLTRLTREQCPNPPGLPCVSMPETFSTKCKSFQKLFQLFVDWPPHVRYL